MNRATPGPGSAPLAVNATLAAATGSAAPNSTGTGPGQVAAFGGASALGGPGSGLAQPVVSMAPTPSGAGYWLAAADGGIFTLGDAPYLGSTGATHLNKPIVAMAPTPSGHGYWLAAADGGIFTFGDAPFQGSLAPEPADTAVSALAAAPHSNGYWLATAPLPSAGVQVQAAALGPTGTPLGSFVVTCYDLSGTTASGVSTNSQTVAVDPSVIPMGSHIYVDGAGSRIAEDTGGAIRGRRLDVWEPSYAACAAWGVQTRQVWLQG